MTGKCCTTTRSSQIWYGTMMMRTLAMDNAASDSLYYYWLCIKDCSQSKISQQNLLCRRHNFFCSVNVATQHISLCIWYKLFYNVRFHLKVLCSLYWWQGWMSYILEKILGTDPVTPCTDKIVFEIYRWEGVFCCWPLYRTKSPNPEKTTVL
jgi:hypothetical protein